ncbi:MAG: toxin-antitoxin system HicB family antitoxin [Acidimicrobiales bacterium]
MRSRQTTVRLPQDLADKADLVARTQGKSLNQLIIDSLVVEIDRVKQDKEFMGLLEDIVRRNATILEALRDH